MKYVVPVTATITGWVEVEADTLKEAKQKAEQLDEDGVNLVDIKDSDTTTECHIDEMEDPEADGVEYQYSSAEDCQQAGQHLTSVDNDGFCTLCGHQDSKPEE